MHYGSKARISMMPRIAGMNTRPTTKSFAVAIVFSPYVRFVSFSLVSIISIADIHSLVKVG